MVSGLRRVAAGAHPLSSTRTIQDGPHLVSLRTRSKAVVVGRRLKKEFGVVMVEAEPSSDIGDGVNVVEFALDCIWRRIRFRILGAQKVTQRHTTAGATARGILK